MSVVRAVGVYLSNQQPLGCTMAKRRTAEAGRSVCGGQSRRPETIDGGSGVVRPSRDIQGLDVKAGKRQSTVNLPDKLCSVRAGGQGVRDGRSTCVVEICSQRPIAPGGLDCGLWTGVAGANSALLAAFWSPPCLLLVIFA